MVKMSKGNWNIIPSCFSIGVSLAGIFGLRKILQEATETADQMRNLPAPEKLPGVSVIVPARNEEKHIADCLAAILEQDYPYFQIIAVNDRSNDRTPEILEEIANQYPDRVQIINANSPGEEWLGKPNALYQGYQLVSPDVEWLLFVDADTKLSTEALTKALIYAEYQKLDMLSFAPLIHSENFWGQLVMPEVLKFYTLLAGNPLKTPKPNSIEEASAVGAFILARRKAYDVVDGHAAVKGSVIEDMELAKAFRTAGFSTRQIPGFDFVKIDWYQGLSHVWEGAGKNLFLVAQKSWGRVAFVLGVELLYGLLPFIVLLSRAIKSVVARNNTAPGKLSRAFNLLAIISVLSFYGYSSHQLGASRRYGLLYPVAAIISSGLVLNSAFRIGILRSVQWKGRTIRL